MNQRDKKVFTPHVRNFHVIQQHWINIIPSWVTLDGTHVVDEDVNVQAILKPYLVVSFMQKI